jgi:hypothetical protein
MVTLLHHSIDVGKNGLLLEADTTTQIESTVFEVDAATGEVLKTWSMADIISSAMIAGGDDPSEFIFRRPTTGFITMPLPMIARRIRLSSRAGRIS